MTDYMPMQDAEYWHEPDFLLTDLVSFMANKLEAQIGVTLLVKGTILTGTLVSERAYLDQMNTLFKNLLRDNLETPTSEAVSMIQEAFGFDRMTEDVYPQNDEDDEAFGASPIRHLHLRDPIMVLAGGVMSLTDSPVPVLRLRLSLIDGWMMGRLAMVRDDDFPNQEIRH